MISTAKHQKSVAGNGDYFLSQPCRFCLWFADLAFYVQLGDYWAGSQMLWCSLNGHVVLFCFLLWSFHLPKTFRHFALYHSFTPSYISLFYFALCIIMQMPCNPVYWHLSTVLIPKPWDFTRSFLMAYIEVRYYLLYYLLLVVSCQIFTFLYTHIYGS